MENQQQHEELVAESGAVDTLELEQCQQKSWGLREKSHTIFGRCTEYLSSDWVIKPHPCHQLQKHDLQHRNLTSPQLPHSFQQLSSRAFLMGASKSLK